MDTPHLAALQAVLFAAPQPLTVEELAGLFDAAVPDVRRSIERLAESMGADPTCGLQVERAGGGYRLATKPAHGDFVERITQVVKAGSLSAAALETLAIIAYRQPITRVEIEEIRGVRVGSALTTLQERDLVEEKGRKEAPGRPVLYGTTDAFLLHFGLHDLSELPTLDTESGQAQLPLRD